MKANKFLAVILAFAMVFSTMTMVGFAAEETVEVIDVAETVEESAEVAVLSEVSEEADANSAEVALASALAAGGNVSLTEDVKLSAEIQIPAGVTAVLDLAGYNITVDYQQGSETKHIYALSNYGDLTIMDSVGTGSITARGIYNQSGAELTVNSCKIVAQDYNGGACIWSYGSGEVYVNNATLIGYTGVISSEGYVEINGGTYTCYSGISDDGTIVGTPTYNIRAYNGLKITDGTFISRHGVISLGGGKGEIYDGEYTIEFAAVTTSNVVYLYGNADMTIYDGKFISDNTKGKADSGAAVVVDGSNVKLDIYNGEYVGMNGMVSGNSNTTIYGGKYDTVWDYNDYSNIEDFVSGGLMMDEVNREIIVDSSKAAAIGKVGYDTLAEAISAAADGETIVVMPGTHKISGNAAKNLTFKGYDKETSIIDIGNKALTVRSTIAFDNITLKKDNVDYVGFHHNSGETYTNCIINGYYQTYGVASFTDCIFNQTSSNSYNVWIYGEDASFDNCTFNSAGKSMLIYNEGPVIAVDVDNCTFNASTAVDGKAAIEIDSSLMKGECVVTVDNSTATGFGAGSDSGNTLYNNKKGGANTALTVDGVKVNTSLSVNAEIIDNEGNTAEKEFSTLQGAVNAVKPDGTITLKSDLIVTKTVTVPEADAVLASDEAAESAITLNLNGHSITAADTFAGGVIDNYGNLVITGDGTIDVSATSNKSQAINNYGTMEIDGVTVIGTEALYSYVIRNFGNMTIEDASVTGGFGGVATELNASTVINDGTYTYIGSGGGHLLYQNKNSSLVINGGTFKEDIEPYKDVYQYMLYSGNGATAVINGGTFTGVENAFGVILFAGKGKITVNGGMFHGKLYASVSDDNADIKAGYFNVDPTDFLDTDNYAAVLNVAGTYYKVVGTALLENELQVQFVEDKASAKEGKKVYFINLVAANTGIINRLNSTDLTFANTSTPATNNGAITYSIESIADSNITINKVYNPETGAEIADRYEFHYDFKSDEVTGTGATVSIGKVVFEGYGDINFTVAESGTNIANATKVVDNIVKSFVPNPKDDTEGKLSYGEKVPYGEIEDVIAIPTRALTINVAYPNKISSNDKDYQQMKITVTGPDNYKNEIYLGDGYEESEQLEDKKNPVCYYQKVISGELVLNTPYTVTVEGLGYRTVKYTVSMTEDKTLNFWNNVMDNDTYVEVAKSGNKYAQKVTFLAGDIVKDNNINVYDLSAVVSYFGEIDLDEDNKPEYAKYDLNRDGKIDSKDVAYVLVSWGN